VFAGERRASALAAAPLLLSIDIFCPHGSSK